MISTIISRLVILLFGTLYPAYASYKAVRTKNVKEYVKWMMYWIVFALFTCAETFTDVFFSWFPFYYEIKIVLVLWLLSPATKGSSILYRKFVHPMLSRREQEIDDYLAKAKEQGYHTVLNLGTKGVNYATTVIMQTAIKGGGGLVNQLKKSYSLSDLTSDVTERPSRPNRTDETEDTVDTRMLRRRKSPHRSSSGSGRVDMYFSEVDVRPGPQLSHVRSTEDVSSGYSSAEPLYIGQPPKLEAREALIRTASVGGSSRPRTRTAKTTVATKKTTTVPEDSESEVSETELETAKTHNSSNDTSINSEGVKENSESSDDAEFQDSIEFPSEINTTTDTTILPQQEATKTELQKSSTEGNIEKDDNCPNVEPEIFSEAVNEEKEDKVPVDEIPKDDEIQRNEAIQQVMEDIINIAEPKLEDNKNIEDDLRIVVKEEVTDIDAKTEVNNKSDLVVNNEENKIENKETDTTSIKSDMEPVNMTEAVSLTSLSQRGGRYNKTIAPPPPESENPIKATLILKPGIIKSVNTVAEEAPTQIFVSHSPKAKRKQKYESPITKLMMLPRKLSFWGSKEVSTPKEPSKSNEEIMEHRKSWQEERLTSPVTSEGSKSDTEYSCENLSSINAERKTVSDIGIDRLDKGVKKLPLRNLSHSPKRYKSNEERFDDSD